MRPTTFLGCCLLVTVAGLCRFALGQERAIINNSDSPHSKLRSVDLSDVRWTNGFWQQKFDLVKEVTIPSTCSSLRG